MKSYDCTICFQFFRYIIHDNGVLEYLELSGTGETKKSESCPLSAYNPIPEKKKKDSPYAGFLLFLFFLALTLNLVNLVLIYFFPCRICKIHDSDCLSFRFPDSACPAENYLLFSLI